MIAAATSHEGTMFALSSSQETPIAAKNGHVSGCLTTASGIVLANATKFTRRRCTHPCGRVQDEADTRTRYTSRNTVAHVKPRLASTATSAAQRTTPTIIRPSISADRPISAATVGTVIRRTVAALRWYATLNARRCSHANTAATVCT